MRQHCVSLSCLCNSLTQIEWVANFSLGDEDSEKIASERYENRHLRRPLSFDAPYLPNPCEYLHKPYIARNYIHQTTFLLLTVWVYLHSNFCGGLQKKQAQNVIECIMAVQSHPRSLIFTPIESSLSTCY